jgi:hypothetical protein
MTRYEADRLLSKARETLKRRARQAPDTPYRSSYVAGMSEAWMLFEAAIRKATGEAS